MEMPNQSIDPSPGHCGIEMHIVLLINYPFVQHYPSEAAKSMSNNLDSATQVQR